MQKQKTIAKWLTIILLTTIAVGCYILSNTLFSKHGGEALGTGQTNQSGDKTDPSEVVPPKHVPYYSLFPRQAETIGSMQVQHVGGENDDSVEALVALDKKMFMFVSSKSTEYDTKDVGLLLAIFDELNLISVSKFADLREHIVDTKLSKAGIVVLTESDTSMYLYQISLHGEVTAKVTIEKVVNARLYLWDRDLWLFCEQDKSLVACKIDDDLKLDKKDFKFSSIDTQIKEIIVKNNSLLLITQSKDSIVKFVSFSPNNGFTLLKQFKQMEFVQLTSIFYENETTYYLLAKQNLDFTIQAYSNDFSLIKEKMFYDTTVARMFSTNTGIRIVTSKVVYHYCRHLDWLSEEIVSHNLTNIIASFTFPDFSLIVNLDKNKLSILKLSDKEKFVSVFECDEVSTAPKILATPTNTFVALTSSKTSDLCHMNFGNTDAFLFVY